MQFSILMPAVEADRDDLAKEEAGVEGMLFAEEAK